VDSNGAEGLTDVVVVVSPDTGFARMYASRLGAPLAIVDKVRSDHEERAAAIDAIGEVGGGNVVLDASPIRRLITTDTVETQPVTRSSKVRVVSAAPPFAEAIRYIHHRQSVSGLFQD
jgi:ribose-phosphate pyrophosphokinase